MKEFKMPEPPLKKGGLLQKGKMLMLDGFFYFLILCSEIFALTFNKTFYWCITASLCLIYGFILGIRSEKFKMEKSKE